MKMAQTILLGLTERCKIHGSLCRRSSGLYIATRSPNGFFCLNGNTSLRLKASASSVGIPELGNLYEPRCLTGA